MSSRNDDDDFCSICLEQYTKQNPYIEINCGNKHKFHPECINLWFRYGNNTCPLDREKIGFKNSKKIAVCLHMLFHLYIFIYVCSYYM